jgi:CRP-like cAMP-binding protein
MSVSVHLLEEFPLLQSLTRGELENLSGHMHLRSFARKAMVLSKNDSLHELGFLVEGRLQGLDFTVDGRSVGLYFVDPGDYFGELTMVDGQAPAEFIMATMKSTVAFVDTSIARQVILGHQELARAVMMRLARRIRLITAQRTLLSLPTPFQRLCGLLLQLPTQPLDNLTTIEPVPTHQELAMMINASRETVTRAFQQLFAQRVLVRDGDSLHIMNLPYIEDIAQGRIAAPKA